MHTINEVSRETIRLTNNSFSSNSDLLSEYGNLLLWWNKKVNLLSRDTTLEQIRFHVKHSLFLTPYLKKIKTLDLGTGGGLPGIPLAICNPDINFVLIDKVERKITAIKDIIRKLKCQNIETFYGKVEDYRDADEVQVISKHAFKIPDILSKSKHLNCRNYNLLKGSDYVDEISTLKGERSIEAINLSEIGASFRGKFIICIF